MRISAAMFRVEQRDQLRERLLAIAREDPRVVAGAEIGSLAEGAGEAQLRELGATGSLG
jgi:hypothetical protein